MPAKAPGRPSRPSGSTAAPTDTREQLIASARRLLSDGPHHLDARTVAGAAGRSLGTFTHHFRDHGMWGLRAAMAAQGYRDMEADMRKAGHGKPPMEGLDAMCRAAVLFALREPALVRLMVSDGWDDEVNRAMTSQQQLMREQLLRCQAVGAIRQADPERIQRLGRACLYGLVLQVLESALSKRQALAAADEVMEDLRQGLLPREHRAPRRSRA